VLFLRQNPEAIDAGAFHNDVVSVGHENIFLYHEAAFANPGESLASIRAKFAGPLHLIPVTTQEVTLQQAVDSYLFNSQIVTLSGGTMLMVSPLECQENPGIKNLIETKIITTDSPVSEVLYLDLRQSMNNGGGPACLRLRVLLTEEEMNSLPERIFITESSVAFLRHWVEQHYPEELTLADLACAHRYFANARALEELRRWIGI
jgi:succinylarginine dihydrolase